MINNEDTNKDQKPEPPKDDGFVDTARMDVQCHILIKEKDSGKTILNGRG